MCHGGPKIPQLLFVDDLLLFAKANTAQAIVVRDIVQLFCQASSHKVSAAKSIAFVSPLVPHAVRENIQRVTGIHITNELGKYLSAPLLTLRSQKHLFDYIIKLHLRLNSWKSKNLSLAGHTYSVGSFWCSRVRHANRVASAVYL